MPMPLDYQHASEDFERFLREVITRTGLSTRNQAFTTVQAVLLAFRRRLDLRDALRFAQKLPPLLRAIFVADWDVDAAPVAVGGPEAWRRDIQSLRRDHNFSPDDTLIQLAGALRASIGAQAYEELRAAAPPWARDFWPVVG